jgi:hypothetical protein
VVPFYLRNTPKVDSLEDKNYRIIERSQHTRGHLMFFEATPLFSIDWYDDEYKQFQWDVHILIEGTLHAGIRYLDTESREELGKLEEWMKKPIGNEAHEHLVDEHVDVLSRNYDQERFLRNMALVALATRLTHSLPQMARSAETFSPRKKRYGKGNQSEFNRLWLEYAERFNIDFNLNADRIAFVEPMRVVRNQIVHDGAEANTLKPFDEITLNNGKLEYLDKRFSESYPEYVSGEEMSAEVNVSEELLEKNINAAIELVGWLAAELRRQELASSRKAP